MKNWKFIKSDVFTRNTTSSVDINKLLLRRLQDLGVTTYDVCCETAERQTIDTKIAALRTQSGTFTEYRALLTQTSTNAPSATIINNTLGSITIGYTSTGIYTFTLTGAFVSGKTWFTITNNTSSVNEYVLVRTSANVLTLTTNNAVGVANALLTDTPFLIQVYS